MKLNNLAAAILMSTCGLTAFAQTNTPNVDQRQENQQRRIDNGVQSGALTAQETNTINKRQAKLEADKQAAKADGKVTRAERRHLRHEENRNSRAIYRKKHNSR